MELPLEFGQIHRPVADHAELQVLTSVPLHENADEGEAYTGDYDEYGWQGEFVHYLNRKSTGGSWQVANALPYLHPGKHNETE